MWKKIKDMLEKIKTVFLKIIEKIKNNEYVIFFNMVWPELKSCAKSPGSIRFIITWLTVSYVLVGYNSRIMYWFNDAVVPILYQMESNFWIDLMTFFLIIIASFDIYNKCKVRYQFDKYVILTLYFISIVLSVYRFCGDYEYFYWIEAISLSYVDIFIIFSIIYLYIAFFNKLSSKLHKSKNTHKDESLLFDGAISNIEEDIFDFKDDVRDIVEEIKKLDSSKTWSIGINAPWGTGKTSFINLVEKEIKKDADYEIIKFNPRTSKSVNHIQEDFFNILASTLSKYDSSFSHNIKAYMESLQLIDESGIVKKIVDFYHIWNKKSLKKSIEDSFASLKKRVLVVVDDFDRLTEGEILEVLKLIDNNAAFPNIIFLTANDKKQVDKLLGDSYKSNDACFIDKFFNFEYHIPLRSYSYISGYIIDELSKRFIDDKNDIEKVINAPAISEEFSKYIPTLRDAKRYINQFMIDYRFVNGDVIVKEFLLVQLIKYRYYELYKKTYNKEFTEPNRSNFNLIKLKENLSNDDNDNKLIILSILKELFNNIPIITDQTDFEQIYRHIYTKEAFNNYFVNKISSSLRMKDMKILFFQEWVDVTRKIDEWSDNIEKINNFINYLHSIYSDRNEENILIYTKILVYTACKTPYSWVYKLFMKNIRISELNNRNFKQELLDNIKDNIKKEVPKIILEKEYDPNLEMALEIHYDYVSGKYNQKDYLLNENAIWSIVENNFESYLANNKDDEYMLGNIFKFAERVEANGRSIMDKGCADTCKKFINNNADWFVKQFALYKSPNNVYCNPSWRFIFKNEFECESYLKKFKDDEVKKADLAWNFWQLYKANGYNPIEFANEGNVQAKIDNHLVKECELLDKLYAIQKEVNKIPDNGKNLQNLKKYEYIKILTDKNVELNNIDLPVILRDNIRDKIERKKNIIKDIDIRPLVSNKIRDFITRTYRDVFSAYTLSYKKREDEFDHSSFDKKYLSKELYKAIEWKIGSDYWVHTLNYTTPVFQIKRVKAFDEKSGYVDIIIKALGNQSQKVTCCRVMVKIEDGDWKIDDFQYKDANGHYTSAK